jgi:hypothetical protein
MEKGGSSGGGGGSGTGGGGSRRPGGVDFSALVDRQKGDHRHERERALPGVSSSSGAAGGLASATFDAFTRMAAGVDGRRLEDKIADPNRPTWEQYKKDNEDKLNMMGGEMKKMAEYRAELDRERERRLTQGSLMMRPKDHAISSSDDDNDDDDESGSIDGSGSNGERSKKRKRSKSDKKEKSKKHKKEKSSKHKKQKSKKPKRSNASDYSENENGAGDRNTHSENE